MADQNPSAMRVLKGLVYGMGVLIVIAIILLSYGFYARITDPDFRAFKGANGERPAELPATAAFGELRVAMQPGCGIVEMRPDGPLLYLRAGPAGACERIIVVDTRAGRLLGSVVVGP